MAKEKDNKKNTTETISDSQKFMGLLAGLKKKFGEDAGVILGKTDIKKSIKWVPVPSPKITDVLGGIGLPRGRQIEIFGPESSGKTSLATYLLACIQAYFFEDKGRFGHVAIIDAEHAFDPTFAQAFGLDLDRVMFTQPISGEEGLSQAQYFLESGLVDGILVDSVDALQPQAIIDGEFGDATMGMHARLMSTACRKFNTMLKATDPTLIWINQIRSAIGQWAPAGQEATTTGGGKALKFYSSVRLEVKRTDTLTEKEKPYGITSSIKAVKNKVGKPFRKVKVDNIWGKGFDIDSEFFSYFREHGLIKGLGWYTFDVPSESGDDEELVKLQGEDKVQAYLKAHPAHLEYLKKKLFDRMTDSVIDDVVEEKLEIGEVPADLEEDEPSFDDLPFPTVANPVVMMDPRSKERTRSSPELEKPELMMVFKGNGTEPPRILTEDEITSFDADEIIPVLKEEFEQRLEDYMKMARNFSSPPSPMERVVSSLPVENKVLSVVEREEKLPSIEQREVTNTDSTTALETEISHPVLGGETPGQRRYRLWKEKQGKGEKTTLSSVSDDLPED